MARQSHQLTTKRDTDEILRVDDKGLVCCKKVDFCGHKFDFEQAGVDPSDVPNGIFQGA